MPTVLITGVSGGIGQALAIEYARSNTRVLGVGRRPFPASLTDYMRSDDYCLTDLGDPAAAATLRGFLDTRGVAALDTLIHNAALGWYGPVAQQSPASIEEILRVNLYAPISVTHALLPRLRRSHGVIAFISSIHSALPAPDFAVYTATKAALDGFARNLRLEERGAVDVIVLWPGPTRTQMHTTSGVPQDRIRSARYAAPQQTAEQIAAAIRRRRSRGTSLANGALCWLAVHFEPQVDALAVMLARRTQRR